jgi:hypothetical protein
MGAALAPAVAAPGPSSRGWRPTLLGDWSPRRALRRACAPSPGERKRLDVAELRDESVVAPPSWRFRRTGRGRDSRGRASARRRTRPARGWAPVRCRRTRSRRRRSTSRPTGRRRRGPKGTSGRTSAWFSTARFRGGAPSCGAMHGGGGGSASWTGDASWTSASRSGERPRSSSVRLHPTRAAARKRRALLASMRAPLAMHGPRGNQGVSMERARRGRAPGWRRARSGTRGSPALRTLALAIAAATSAA